MAIKVLPALLLGVLFLVLLSSSWASTNILISGQSLNPGQSLTEGNYAITLRNDCNLVLTDNGALVASSFTAGRGTNCLVTMQYDGDFVLFDDSRNAIWSTNTSRADGHYILVLQPDRNVVLYGSAYFQSGTTKTA